MSWELFSMQKPTRLYVCLKSDRNSPKWKKVSVAITCLYGSKHWQGIDLTNPPQLNNDIIDRMMSEARAKLGNSNKKETVQRSEPESNQSFDEMSSSQSPCVFGTPLNYGKHPHNRETVTPYQRPSATPCPKGRWIEDGPNHQLIGWGEVSLWWNQFYFDFWKNSKNDLSWSWTSDTLGCYPRLSPHAGFVISIKLTFDR